MFQFVETGFISFNRNRWDYYPSKLYSSRFITHFITSLGLLPNLRRLSIIFESNDFHPNFSFEPLSELFSISIEWRTRTRPPPHVIHEISKLVSRSPDLETFELTLGRGLLPETSPTFGDVFSSLRSLPPGVCLGLNQIKLAGFSVAAVDFIAHSRHFKRLEILEMLHIGDPLQASSSMAGICHCLEHERIYLKGFVVECIHPPEVFHYLSSYSGLEHLRLYPNHLNDDSTKLVDQFFSLVLPLHCNSLHSLEVGTDTPTAWTELTKPQLEYFENCTSLSRISCRVSCVNSHGTFFDGPMVGQCVSAQSLILW